MVGTGLDNASLVVGDFGINESTTKRRHLQQLKVMSAIEHCRTAALGGHIEACAECGHQRIAYNSCLMGKSSNGESADHLVSTAGGFQR